MNQILNNAGMDIQKSDILDEYVDIEEVNNDNQNYSANAHENIVVKKNIENKDFFSGY